MSAQHSIAPTNPAGPLRVREISRSRSSLSAGLERRGVLGAPARTASFIGAESFSASSATMAGGSSMTPRHVGTAGTMSHCAQASHWVDMPDQA
jgi:hypothetical protein